MKAIVGVDIGGTNIVIGTITVDGDRIEGVNSRPTPVDGGPEGVIDQVADMVHESMEVARAAFGDVEILGVGLGCPGPINTSTGIVTVSPNLGWKNVPLRAQIGDRLGMTTTLDNDASCAILGEVWRGAAQGASVVVGLTVGTGVGGGIILDGRIFHGASDVAGEFGHMTIDSTGRRCACGNYGCLEAYASGRAIAARATEGLEAGINSALTYHVAGDFSRITAEIVYDAANEGDEFATEVVRDTAHFLGTGVANIVNIFNPEMVVLCGGVTKAGERLFAPIRQEVNRRAFKPAAEACQIVPGTLPGTAGVYGAAAVFKHHVIDS